MQIPTLFGEVIGNTATAGVNKQNIYLHVHNSDSTTILRGAPVCWAADGDRDAQDVTQSATASTNKATAYFAGIAMQDIPADAYGLVICYGIAPFVRCSGSVAIDTSLSVNPAAANFVGGATQATIIAVTSIGPGAMLGLVTAVATATVEGVTNVCARVIVRTM